MKSEQLLSDHRYAPNAFLNWLMETHNLKNDRQLAEALDTSPPIISKIRNRHMAIGPVVLIGAHELTGLKISELRDKMMMAD